MSQSVPSVIYTKLGASHRLSLPADLCRSYGFTPGVAVTIEAVPDGLMVRPVNQLLHDVQSAFSSYRVEGESTVDELIAERRAEAKREASLE